MNSNDIILKEKKDSFMASHLYVYPKVFMALGIHGKVLPLVLGCMIYLDYYEFYFGCYPYNDDDDLVRSLLNKILGMKALNDAKLS